MTSSKAALEWNGRTDSACVASNIDCWSLTGHHNSVLLWYVSEEGIWKKTLYFCCYNKCCGPQPEHRFYCFLVPKRCCSCAAVSMQSAMLMSVVIRSPVKKVPCITMMNNKQMQTNLLLLYSTVSP